jgi:hypothetical protein
MAEIPQDERPPFDVEDVRRRAHELSRLRPHATAEENWLAAEAELLAQSGTDPRAAAAAAAETEANVAARIKMTVFGHS